jgi:hypothetical protein
MKRLQKHLLFKVLEYRGARSIAGILAAAASFRSLLTKLRREGIVQTHG